MTQESCPRCFAPPGEDGHPDCACAAREDTAGSPPSEVTEPADEGDQMHVRPYVSLGTVAAGEPASPDSSPDEAPARTAELPVVDGAEPEGRDGRTGGTADVSTGGGPAGRAGSGGPADPPNPPGPADPATPDEDPEPAGRRKGVLLALAIAVVVAVVAVTAGVAVLGGDDTSGPRATPEARAALPSAAGSDDRSGSASAPAGTDGTASASPGVSPTPNVSDSPSSTTSPSEDTSASPDQGPTGGSAASASESGQVTESPAESAPPAGPPVLREGDTGPEVVELQKRMSQLLLRYLGRPDGTYDAELGRAVARYQKDRDITTDPSGVYGPATREDLESRTKEP